MDLVMPIMLLLITAVLCLQENIYGLVCFLAIRILVPETVRLFNGLISLNTGIILVICIVFCIKEKKIKYRKNDNFLLMLSLFSVYSIISLIISDYANFSAQLSYTIQFIITDILPPILAVLIIKSYDDVLLICKTLIVSIIVCGVYGCISFVIGSNPYLDALGVSLFEMGSSWRGADTSSTFASVNALGYFVSMSIPIVFFIDEKKLLNSKITKLSIFFVFILTVMSKKRAAFVTVLFFVFMWWFCFPITKKKIRILLTSIICCSIGITIVLNTPGLEILANFIRSSFFFWNDSMVISISGGNVGSTFEMRIGQILYPFIEISNNFLFGHGKGWCAYYLSTHPFHPIMFGFETITSRIICEYGLVGIPLYTYVFINSYKYSEPKGEKSTNYSMLYVFTVLVMSIATGLDYYYLFFVYIVFIHKVLIFSRR